jgi:threonylcarbamoyladenosine tRNA methylthiotransferase MtaB
MQVYLTTLGCRLNEAELESWARSFAAAGHRVVAGPEQADVMVVNSCAVTTEAARKSRKLVSGLHRHNPSARMVLTGCFAELEPQRAAGLAGVDLVVGNADKDRLVELVSEQLDDGAMPVLATEPDGQHLYRHGGRTRAFIKVQDGCRNRCTFCIVTIARGDERSRPIAQVVDEVNALAAAGYREAVITGVHLGGYGGDLGTDLAALVRALLADTDIGRLRLSSLEPWDLPPGFFELWADPRLMPHLHLPLQSGCDTVLRRMSRRCSTDSYRHLVAEARATIPDLTVTTDLIVGFPGETEAEHRASLAFAGEIGFGHVHGFSFSAREGTKAARLSGQLSGDRKRARSRELHALAARMKRAHLERFAGSERPVLWESAQGAGRFAGYTDNYLRVETTATDDLENRITVARLEAIDEAGERLIARAG